MMEVSSHIHRPPPCNGASFSHLRIRPLLPTFPAGTCHLPSQSITWRKGSSRIGFSSTITATADYSKRRPRRNSISKTKGAAPKGFMPKSPAGTSFQKKKNTNNVKKEGPGPDLGGYDGPTSGNKAELKIDDEKSRSQIVLTSSPIVSLVKTKPVADDAQVKSDGRTSSISEEGLPIGRGDDTERESFTHEISTDVAERNEENILVYSETESKDQDHDSTSLKTRAIQKVEVGERSVMLINEKGKNDQTDLAEGDEIEKVGSALGVSEGLRETKSLGDDKLDEGLSNDVEEEYAIPKIDSEIDENEEEKMLGKDGTEEKSFAVDRWDERVVEEYNAQEIERSSVEPEDLGVRLELLENLIKENHMLGNKVCVYPEVLTPDQEIEIFFNRSISTLKGELSILIMGGFNNWRWKSFTEKLEKTTLTGDWWSCKIYVPKEAYKMDFVFFNGSEVYDNNDSMDFMLPVKGGMDEIAFEDFLLEEKRRELERLAAEEAERERRAEEQRRIEAEKAAKEEAEKERRAVEQRRIEAEKAAMEADKAQAKVEVEKRRLHLKKVTEKAASSVENVWHIVPSNFKGEDLVRLYYNRQQRPVAHSSEVWIHGGYNSWKDGLSIVGKLVRTEKEGGDWWYAHVIVPDRALVLDWVFTDGPPESAKVYDNNNSQDFHAIVPESINEELYWVEEEHQVFKKLQDERRQREEAIRAKAEKAARLKAETKEKTMKAFLLSQKHVVYTEPLDVQAGSTVTVFYNPSNTVLNGKSEVWLRCAFNRWTHPHSPLPPQKMISAENGSHLKATVNVPLDAYMMDFVFSEEEDGGIFDNRNGTDYHIPVVGGIANEPPMSIVHIAVEMAPIAKVGGLGDVVTSLSRAVQDLGHNVDIILPKYDCLNLGNVKGFQLHRSYPWGGTEIKVWHGIVEGLSVYFLDPQNGLFRVGCIYGKANDGERFDFFCHAALEYLLQSGSHPDIIHCHDWSSAPVAWLYKDHYHHDGLVNARVVFTIHNLEFGAHLIGKAMTYTDRATTVSPNYLREVSGNAAIAPHLYKFHGILNGIDPDIWDPSNDKFIPVSYTSENVVEGKRAAKEALQQRVGLHRSDRPLVGIITRLTFQKGIHLIKHAIGRTLEHGGQVVLLGSAPDPRIQNDFVSLKIELSYSTHVHLCLSYDEPLSHLIYAGADFILVPSIFEPCGLTQLIAMRYGSIPVVRKTGGLYDTVFDVDNDKERAQSVGLEPNGFSFDGADAAGVDYALNRAISAWYDGRDWFNVLCKRGMEQDWSWNRPALDYMELYYSARK